MICDDCAGHGTIAMWDGPELIAGGRALARYDQPLGDVVRRAKGQRDRRLARALAAVVARRVSADPHSLALVHASDVITWAPSAWTRRVQRGFSLSALLAAELGTLTPTPVIGALTVRRGSRQASLGRRSRQRNLRGRLRSTRELRGRVVLVDDVVTTGATATACARELLGAGAESVHLLAVCHVSTTEMPETKQGPGYSVQIL